MVRSRKALNGKGNSRVRLGMGRVLKERKTSVLPPQRVSVDVVAVFATSGIT